jgi:hypothetical protein
MIAKNISLSMIQVRLSLAAPINETGSGEREVELQCSHSSSPRNRVRKEGKGSEHPSSIFYLLPASISCMCMEEPFGEASESHGQAEEGRSTREVKAYKYVVDLSSVHGRVVVKLHLVLLRSVVELIEVL